MSPRTFRHAAPTILAAAVALHATIASAQGEANPAPAGPLPSPVTPPIVGGAASPAPVDQPTAASPRAAEPAKEEKKNPWHGSYLLFDQSVTTQTIHLGSDYQSADPVYEWWFRLAPRYSAYEDKDQELSLNLWANLYKEFTNSDETTRKQENVIGATTVWATYSRKILRSKEWITTASIAPVRITLPTDQASRDSGQLFGLGASAGLSQAIPINGKSATWFPSARVGASLIYNHPFTRATNAVNSDLDRTRQDAAGRTFTSDMLRGSMLVKHQANVAFSAGLQIHEKLSFSASYILLNSWAYKPTNSDCAISQPGTGCIAFGTTEAPDFRASSWLLASLDYDVIPELGLSVGYYNLASQLAPDSTRRDPLWSPDARVFFTITGNLDAIFDDIAGAGGGAKKAAKSPSLTLGM